MTIDARIPLMWRPVDLQAAHEGAQRVKLMDIALQAQERERAVQRALGTPEEEAAYRQKQRQAQDRAAQVELDDAEYRALGNIARVAYAAGQQDPAQAARILEEQSAVIGDKYRPLVDRAVSAFQTSPGQGMATLESFLGMGEQTTQPAAVREFEYVEALNPEARQRYMNLKRNGWRDVTTADGGKALVNPTTNQTQIIATGEQVRGAAAAHAGAVETATRQAEIGTIPQEVATRTQAELTADAPRAIAAAETQIAQIDNVMREAGLAIDQAGFWTTGLPGAVLQFAPGSDARALRGKIQTVKANLATDKLQAMRDLSKTGGALGNVSEGELGLLENSVVALDQANGADEVRRALTEVMTHYGNVRNTMLAIKAVNEGRIGEEQATAELQSQYTYVVKNEADYNEVPQGARYLAPDGVMRVKQ